MEPSDDAAPLTADALFDVLGHPCRRVVLGHLAEAGGTMSVDELVEALASSLPGHPDPSSIRLSLHHVHLPKLRNSGLVEGSAVADSVTLRWGREVNLTLLLLDAVDRTVGPSAGRDPDIDRSRRPDREDGPDGD